MPDHPRLRARSPRAVAHATAESRRTTVRASYEGSVRSTLQFSYAHANNCTVSRKIGHRVHWRLTISADAT